MVGRDTETWVSRESPSLGHLLLLAHCVEAEDKERQSEV